MLATMKQPPTVALFNLKYVRKWVATLLNWLGNGCYVFSSLGLILRGGCDILTSLE